MLRSYRGRPAQRPGFLPAPPAEAPVLQGRAVDLAVLRRIGRRGPQHAPSVRKRWFGGGGGGARRSRGGGRRTRKTGQALRGRADRHRPGCSHALTGLAEPLAGSPPARNIFYLPPTIRCSSKVEAPSPPKRRPADSALAHRPRAPGRGPPGGKPLRWRPECGGGRSGPVQAPIIISTQGPLRLFHQPVPHIPDPNRRVHPSIKRASLISRSSHCCYPRRMRARIPLPAPALGSIIGGSGLR